jgi:small subunit ribosomal protein S6|tara:strand:+ start:4472 stop:4825 length:354 start_codon:yes stop_codon:yes gene_type:complete
MNYYEILYVVNPNHGKDKISEIIGELSAHIESKKHAIVDHNFWEKKQLAYPVNKQKYGNYILLNAEFTNSDFVNEFKVFLNLHKEVLKYIIIKLDEKPSAEKEEAATEQEDKKEEEN